MFNRLTNWGGIEQLRRDMDRLFDHYRTDWGHFPYRRHAYPALNVWDSGEAFCVEAELPGVRQEDLEMYAVGNELTLKGRRQPLEGETLIYHRQERGTGEFTRVITLPCEVDAAKVDAVLKDGVLTLQLPKAEKEKPRRITVKATS